MGSWFSHIGLPSDFDAVLDHRKDTAVGPLPAG